MYLTIKSCDITVNSKGFQSSTKNSTEKPVEKPVETVNNTAENVRKTRKQKNYKLLKLEESRTFLVGKTRNLL